MKKKKPENLVKKEIKDWLDWKGWFHFPIFQTLGSYAGIPDIIACKKGIVLFIECKAAKGIQSVKQKEFEADIINQKCHYVLARGYEDIDNYIKNIKER